MAGPWVIDPAKMTKLDGLSPEQRAVLSLVLDARKSYGEAAKILGVSETTVRERAHAAIDALARDPVREPPSPVPPEAPPPKRSGTSLKGGLLTGLVLGSIAAVIILLTSGGNKTTSSTSTSTPALARHVPTTVHTATPTFPTSRSTSISALKSTTTKASPSPSVLSITAKADGEPKYNVKSLTATAGLVSIDFTNSSPLDHNVTVANSTGEVLGSTTTFRGGSRTLSLTLKAGTYRFYSSVPGQRTAGMEGTLAVR